MPKLLASLAECVVKSMSSLWPLSGSSPLSGAGLLSLVQGNLATRTRLIQSNYTPKNPKLLGQMILSSFAEEKKTKGADISPKEKSNNS